MIDKLNLEKLNSWLKQNIEKVPYGEISIKLIMHDGQIRRIEKTLVEREQEGQG